MKKIDYNYMIETMEDVKDIINGKFEINQNSNLKSFYRGQSNADWKLVPKIARTNDCSEPIVQNNKDIFSVLAKKQHYGDSTRLLDFTTDVKIALFFACQDNLECDAKLYVYYYDSITENSNYTKIGCEFSQLSQEIDIDSFSELISEKYNIDIDNAKNTILSILDCGFMITPTNEFYQKMFGVNDRIIKQKGCFYIPSNISNYAETKRHNYLLSNSYKHVKIQPKCVSQIYHNIVFYPIIKIPYELKRQIIQLLADYGITKKSLGFEE